ncbi:MAG: hypothetical protein LUD26_04625 [Bacteroides uniformis]|nr:hypothetical protein [Bacteroides uniformis]
MAFTICDHRERIASTHRGGARFSGAMAARPTFFGIPKDNLATPKTEGLATSTVNDGFEWFRLLFRFS